MEDTATFMLGKDAYRYLKMGEGYVREGVSYAKTTIIVRSVVVAWENIMSNNLHLVLRGIDPVTVLRKKREKFIEITQFVKNQEQKQAMELELNSIIDEPKKASRIRAQIQALDDANKNMSIAPLIEAGEFSTISEDLSEADVAVREGEWPRYMEKAAEKLPGGLVNGLKNVFTSLGFSVS